MFLVLDTSTNNVLGEFEEYHAAEQRRIRIVGMNPELAPVIEVVDLDGVVAAYRDARVAPPAREAQPA